MKTLRFENLIDTNTGKTVEVEVPDNFDENNQLITKAGELGRMAGAKLFKEFGNKK